jgi:hypothetical protein
MMASLAPAPRSGVLETGQTRRAGDAGYDAVTASYYSTCAPPGIPQRHCSRLMTWLRYYACHRAYFPAGSPVLQLCPACAGGQLHPIALWEVRRDAAPPEMLLGGEVSHAHLG